MAGKRKSPTLEMLLLSLLKNRDSLSGYEIAAILAGPVVLMWSVKHSQIYPALTGLERGGDVFGTWVVQVGRPNKKSYQISDAGEERLRTWLLQSRETLSQDEVKLISYNLDLVGQDEVMRVLTAYRQQCEREKSMLEDRWVEAWDALGADHAAGDRITGIRSVYEHALAIRDAEIAWCADGLDRARRKVDRAGKLTG